MLSYHNIDNLSGKVSSSILNMYKMDYNNLVLSSIIAGFHRAFGLRSEGNTMSIEIINTVKDDTDNLNERNVLIWNLYILSKEFMDDGIYDEAMNITERAEKNWSRDVILGDEIGVYHISWLEQILLRKAEIYMLISDSKNFEKITDSILCSRFKYFNDALEHTGEPITYDRCTYSCFELMAFECRKRDIETAVKMMKQAVSHKGGRGAAKNLNMKIAQEKENPGNFYRVFDIYYKYFNKLPQTSYDCIKYGYCSTCYYLSGEGLCSRLKMPTEAFKACRHYRFKK